MSTPFDGLAIRLNGAVDRMRGEAFTLSPRRKPDVNGPPVADDSRAAVDFRGTYDDPGNRAGSGRLDWEAANIQSKGARPGHTSDRPAVNAERRLFADRPRQGDLLLRAATGERFVIAEVVPVGSLYVLQLNR